MKYPTLSELNTSREWLDVFKGYNHNLRAGDGEFYEMTNLSSDHFPILSPRSKRGIYAHPSNPMGLVAKDDLCYVDGGDFVIGEDRVPMGFTVDKDEDGKIIPKTLISMGAYVIIMPDKKYINLADFEYNGSRSDYGNIENSFDSEMAGASFALCKKNGEEYENLVAGSYPPVITEEMMQKPATIPVWSTGKELKQYSVADAQWVTIPDTYIQIGAANIAYGIGHGFSVGDGVYIDGIDAEAAGAPTHLNGLSVIQARTEAYIVVRGYLEKAVTQINPITVRRKMPDLDLVVEAGNRLWGCRYGIQGDKIVNEIYASKLGDFKNWNCFEGISTDSYAVSVGTDGQFTGAITYLGHPMFFKESCMHKVFGNYPSNYQVQTTACRGVQSGCGRSLAIVNEVLYYKSRSGICAYDGSLPEEISAAFGNVAYRSAVAGALGNKYYISMADESERWHLFVFDTAKRMWHREDDTEAVSFCTYKGDLYYIDYADKQIKTVKGTGVLEVDPVKWEAVTGIIGTDSPDKKYISRMDVRMSLSSGSRVSFYVEYDSSGEWEYLFAMDGIKLRTFPVPIRPKRCDHLRLRIVGLGDAKIYSICKTVEWGSDV